MTSLILGISQAQAEVKIKIATPHANAKYVNEPLVIKADATTELPAHILRWEILLDGVTVFNAQDVNAIEKSFDKVPYGTHTVTISAADSEGEEETRIITGIVVSSNH
jgi:hypothetical protein